jgi:alpha-L-fucosidase 2
MHEPLIQMVKDLSETGKETAKTMYKSRGWVAHHNTDIWRITGVVDFANAGMWPMGGAWLSQHLWEKYLYSGDKNYLQSIYPILKSAAQFYEDFLIEEPDASLAGQVRQCLPKIFRTTSGKCFGSRKYNG